MSIDIKSVELGEPEEDQIKFKSNPFRAKKSHLTQDIEKARTVKGSHIRVVLQSKV